MSTNHGGQREGAGRKPLLDAPVKRTWVLTEYHLSLIEQWQQAHNCSASEALRQMLESAASAQ